MERAAERKTKFAAVARTLPLLTGTVNTGHLTQGSASAPGELSSVM
jgi:hypothetical protein